MITQEHLEHWLSEIKYALQGIENEISENKLKSRAGINFAVSFNSDEDVYVSFEYLQEKANTLRGLIKCIEDDIRIDKIDPALQAKIDAKKKFQEEES